MASAGQYEAEVAFISKVDADGDIAATSYGTWDGESPPGYGDQSNAAKWGSPIAGTGSGVITYWFDDASNWTTAEKAVWRSGMDLWSAEANLTFAQASSAASANFTIIRGNDGAFQSFNATLEKPVGGDQLSTPPTTGSVISMNTNDPRVGALTTMDVLGGAAYETVVHELGHLLGLGHGGPYNGNVQPSAQFGPYDSQLFSLMSYIDPTDSKFQYQASNPDTQWGAVGEFNYEPITPMMLDILAIQRLYGGPSGGPLSSGGQIFGFNCNVGGTIGQYYDLTQTSGPFTIWDGGTGNALDLSGYSQNATISLIPGTFTSAGGKVNNIVIALDTTVETAIGGTGDDTIYASDTSSHLAGGPGNDTLIGGAGKDTLTGGARSDQFIFDSAVLTDVQASTAIFDEITDYDQGNSGSYNAAEGDKIDLSALLSTAYNHGSGQTVGALARAVRSGTRTYLQVDSDGAANGVSWTTIAQLDGNLAGSTVTAILDASQATGATITVQNNAPKDFDGDGSSDILLHDGQLLAVWEMNGTVVQPGSGDINTLGTGWSVAGIGDFNNDGRADILLQNGQLLASWEMNGRAIQPGSGVINTLGAGWSVAGTGDFDGDGNADILLQNGQQLAAWEMNGTAIQPGSGVINTLGAGWSVAGTGDFDGDGHSDILLQNGQQLAAWEMSGTAIQPGSGVINTLGAGWSVAGTGDFDGDGHADILLQNNQLLAAWEMNGTTIQPGSGLINTLGAGWSVAGTGDFNGDGRADLLLQNAQQLAGWEMNGTQIQAGSGLVGTLATGWGHVA